MYRIERLEGRDPLFIFTTVYGVTYFVSFLKMEIGNEYFENLYAVDFGRIGDAKKPNDGLIEYTIKQVILDFFSMEPKCLIHYVCNSMDGRHRSRSRLFSNWFLYSQERSFHKLIVNYKDEEIHYTLEFIFHDNHYSISELEDHIIKQMNEFSELK